MAEAPINLADLLLSASPNLPLKEESATEYLDAIQQLPLEILMGEPLKLSELSTQLDADLSQQCFRSYSTFLLANEATDALGTSFSALDSHLDSFLEASQSLNAACKTFEKSIASAMTVRNRIASIADHVDSTEELLALPKLIGTCIRSGHWQEAMDLSKRVDEYKSRMPLDGKGWQIIDRMFQAAEEEMSHLKTRILELMRSRSLKLPAAVRAINMLSILVAADEEQEAPLQDFLQLVLLRSRWECMTSQIAALKSTSTLSSDPTASEDRAKFVKKWVELWREIVGDAVTIYTEIFLASVDQRDALAIKNARKPLVLFLHHALDQLVKMLKTHIQHIHAVSSLSSLLTQLTYCATAFTRFGFDFRQSITSLIQDRVGSIVCEKMQSGLEDLRFELAPRRNKTSIETLLLAPESLPKVMATEMPLLESAATLSHQPPTQLSLFPPLARFLNAIALALNELRLIPAVQLYERTGHELGETLQAATDLLLPIIEDALKSCISVPPTEDEEEATMAARTAKQRKQVCELAIGFWSRAVLPWSERALRVGIYSEYTSALGEDMTVTDLRSRCEEQLTRAIDQEIE